MICHLRYGASQNHQKPVPLSAGASEQAYDSYEQIVQPLHSIGMLPGFLQLQVIPETPMIDFFILLFFVCLFNGHLWSLIYLSMYLSAGVYIYLSVYLSIYVSIHVSIYHISIYTHCPKKNQSQKLPTGYFRCAVATSLRSALKNLTRKPAGEEIKVTPFTPIMWEEHGRTMSHIQLRGLQSTEIQGLQ